MSTTIQMTELYGGEILALQQDLAAGEAPLRLMALHAHPDDESSKGAATMAKYAAEGVDVLVVTCTGGERGDILNPKLIGNVEIESRLQEVRRAEMAAAIQALGVRHAWLGFVDSGMDEGEPPPEGSFASLTPEEAAIPLVALLRKERPQVIATYDETGGYPHPDHIMTHTVTIAALNLAADPTWRPDLGAPWTVSKVYYNGGGFSWRRMQTMHDALIAAGVESPLQEWMDRRDSDDREDRAVTTQIHCSDFFDARDRALLAHATQIDPDGFFFAIPRDIEVATWPTDEFELVYSAVETTIPETDLFAGIR